MAGSIVVLGVFVADTAYRADRQPAMGETILGLGFKLGPGGKGSNQAVAAAKLGVETHFITRLGVDTFADMANDTWRQAGVTPAVIATPESYTGAAYIFVDDKTGDNAIIVAPGAAAMISPGDIDVNARVIREASVFITQLEQPIDAAIRALRIAREADVTTVFNPAPAADLPAEIYALCDYVTPNETEAQALTGLPVESLDDARAAAAALRAKGARAAIITLGKRGALLQTREQTIHVPAVSAGPVVETTGAGDAFNGGFAAALAKGYSPEEAVKFGCAVAGVSVTRAGTAPSMPSFEEAMALYKAQQD